MLHEVVQRRDAHDQALADSPEQAAVQAKARRGGDHNSGDLSPGSQPGYDQQVANLAPVQANGKAEGRVHDLASHGTSGSGSTMPHSDRIQASFGHHDISNVQAYSGGKASEATKGMGASAYATGNKVAFGGSPDLHTAAHEAAHVVQQRAGVSLKGGVGQVGDKYEQHADQVADAVVQGKSAAGILDKMSGKAPGVQRKAVQLDKQKVEKKVGGKAAARLPLAAAGIAYCKGVMSFGAGNQYEALKATKFNSNYRLAVMRDLKYWDIHPSVIPLCQQYPNALTAAMAEEAHGGNCGEHAAVGYDYLRSHAKGHQIAKAAVKGFDHAFVLIGDLTSDTDADIVVCDPWPTAATACLWEDHFAHAVSSDRKDLEIDTQGVADGVDAKKAIARGIKLNALGLQVVKMSMSSADTDKEIKKGTTGPKKDRWIWKHENTAKPGHDYEYTSP